MTRHLDTLVKKHTSYPSFAALVSVETDYTPTLLIHQGDPAQRKELRTLANAYDQFMERAGSKKRCFRGSMKVA